MAINAIKPDWLANSSVGELTDGKNLLVCWIQFSNTHRTSQKKNNVREGKKEWERRHYRTECKRCRLRWQTNNVILQVPSIPSHHFAAKNSCKLTNTHANHSYVWLAALRFYEWVQLAFCYRTLNLNIFVSSPDILDLRCFCELVTISIQLCGLRFIGSNIFLILKSVSITY